MPRMNSSSDSLLSVDVVKYLIAEIGVDTAGIAEANQVRSRESFAIWLERGYAGEMTYLARNLDKRFDPEKLLTNAKSIIVVGLNYFPSKNEIEKQNEPYKVARYAWGEDYHNILRHKLRRLRTKLKAVNPKLRGRICIDTAPFMDKYWAQKAGLGWQGKHTNLVSRQFGSWLLIGSLIINIEVDKYNKPQTNHCGKCTACLDACPTGALIAPYRIDATRCISYWTIESKADQIPEAVENNLNNYVFGCDICLEVCPFNKFQKQRCEKELFRREKTGLLENGQAVDLSEEQFNDFFATRPISRPALSGIKRNIKAASVNRKHNQLR
jgi:epoxyqueuosine reductase